MNKTIELSKEQEILMTDRVVYDVKRCFKGAYSFITDFIYYAEKAVRVSMIVVLTNLAAVGAYTVYSAYQQHIQGKSIGYVIEGAQVANTAAPVAYDESSIEADLAAANKRLRKGAKYVD